MAVCRESLMHRPKKSVKLKISAVLKRYKNTFFSFSLFDPRLRPSLLFAQCPIPHEQMISNGAVINALSSNTVTITHLMPKTYI